jgi:hypothetical protein
MGRACGTHGVKINAFEVTVGETEGKESLGKPKHKWTVLNTMLRKSMGWCKMDLSESGQEPVVGAGEHGNEHLGSIQQGPHISQKCGSQFQILGNMK